MDRRKFIKKSAITASLLITGPLAMGAYQHPSGYGGGRGGNGNGCRKFRDNDGDGNCDLHANCHDKCNRKPVNVKCDKFKDTNKDFYCDLSGECEISGCYRRKTAQTQNSPTRI